MSCGPNPAKRENDARLRKGGRKVLIPARYSPAADAQAKAAARAKNESLGEYLERLVWADAAQSSPPVTGC
jgi:hypothetical protein